MSEHVSYFSDVLGGLYCREDGEPAPCLHNRQLWEAQQDRAVTCKCSHALSTHQGGKGECWSAACGCRVFRDSKPIPARFDERYDPSPEPIDRRIS